MRAYSPIWLWLCCSVVCLLAAHQCGIAQGGGGGRCWQVVSGSDEGCTANECLSTDGCTAYPFTASCTGNYIIDAWTKCPSGACYKCMSCVNIYEDGHYMANCHTTNCDHETCEYLCSGVWLEAGRQYTMYVCLIPCANNSCSGGCEEDCMAYGCVRHNALPACYQ
jgi:hypothetical protein